MSAGAAPVAGQAIATDVLCPRCNYNLRGLVELRCPECGLVFSWDDLDVEKRWQSRLFEFRPGVASYLRTQWRMLLPPFPRRLLFVPRLRPSRLVVFHLVGAALLLLGFLPTLAYGTYDVRRESLLNRSATFVWMSSGPTEGMTPAQKLDYFYPLPGTPHFWPKVFERVGAAATFTVVGLLAPYAAVSAAMLLPDFLRLAGRSKLRAAQVMIYASDPFVPAVLVGVFLAVYPLYRLALGKGVDVEGFNAAVVLGVLVASLHSLLRVANCGRVLYRQWWKGGLLAFLASAMTILLPVFVLLMVSIVATLAEAIWHA